MKLLVALALAVAAAALLLLAGHRSLPSWYAEAMPAAVARQVYPLEHEAVIRETASRQRLDPALIAAVICQESSYRETVVSESGAIGLMQVQPQTAEEIARRTGGGSFETTDLKDPTINIRYGAAQLRYLLDRYHGDETAALAAYHAGLGSVDGWLKAAGAARLETSAIPYDDTRAYVERVRSLCAIYRDAHRDALWTEP